MIVKTRKGYTLKSKTTGKSLGSFPTKSGAQKRERQIQFFKSRRAKHQGK